MTGKNIFSFLPDTTAKRFKTEHQKDNKHIYCFAFQKNQETKKGGHNVKQKALSVLVVTVVLGILLVGLTGAEETMQETETFKFMVPDKWEFTVFQNGAVQIYNRMGTSMVELKKEGLYRTHGRSQNLYRPGWRGA